eukprot:7773465-Lingulodinium_polyedra.AAC.1
MAVAKAWGRGAIGAAIQRIFDIYQRAGHPATRPGAELLDPIPPPGWPARAGWRKGMAAKGP